MWCLRVQGMNFLSAMLLVVMPSELDAFWMFVVMVERLLPADYFTDGLTGVRVDSNILVDLMGQRLPTLHAHFDAIDVLPMLTLVTNQWFISLFVFWLPTEALLRVWDCFFFDGLKSKNKTFFRAALTLFKIHEDKLKTITDVQVRPPHLKPVMLAPSPCLHDVACRNTCVPRRRPGRPRAAPLRVIARDIGAAAVADGGLALDEPCPIRSGRVDRRALQ
jgi:hypothetical protein